MGVEIPKVIPPQESGEGGLDKFKAEIDAIENEIKNLPENEQNFIHAIWQTHEAIDVLDENNIGNSNLARTKIVNAFNSILDKLKGEMNTSRMLEIEKIGIRKYQNEKAIMEHLKSQQK